MLIRLFQSIREILLVGHRQAFAWVDDWHGMSLDDVREYEERMQAETNARLRQGANALARSVSVVEGGVATGSGDVPDGGVGGASTPTTPTPAFRLGEKTADLEARFADAHPVLRAFAGTRTDDGMDYREFADAVQVTAPRGAPAITSGNRS